MRLAIRRPRTKRTKRQCFCNKCNGKFVDPRMKKRHMRNMSKIINYQETRLSDEMDNNEMGDNDNNDDNNENDNEMGDNDDNNNGGLLDDIEMLDYNETGDNNNAMEYYNTLPKRGYSFLTKQLPSEKSQLVKKGKFSDRVLKNLLSGNMDGDGDGHDSDGDGDGGGDYYDYDDSDDFDDETDDNYYEENDFVSPDFDYEPKRIPPNLNNDTYTWVILWILQYQQRYKLSNVATDSLFKFISRFLLIIDARNFSFFPSSLYMAKKDLGISAIF
jgi:hypothetical protein